MKIIVADKLVRKILPIFEGSRASLITKDNLYIGVLSFSPYIYKGFHRWIINLDKIDRIVINDDDIIFEEDYEN